MRLKRICANLVLLLAILCITLMMPTASITANATEGNIANTEQTIDYPEIKPENLTCRYGYEYLGTLENGELFQKFYNYLDDLAWEFYCSDEEVMEQEISKGSSDSGEEVEIISYVAIKEDMKEQFTKSELDIILANWGLMQDCFLWDNPLYYYISSIWFDENYNVKLYVVYQENEGGDLYESFTEDYISVENRKFYRELIESKLHEYYALTVNLDSDYEKEIAIYEKVMSEVDYFHDNLYAARCHNVLGVFLEDRTVCEGYAKAFQLACNYCGIDCIYVSGWASEAHSWNAVKLEEEWYCVDATWDDVNFVSDEYPIYNTSLNSMADANYTKLYLNIPVEEFSLSHTPADENSEFNATDLDWPEFSNNDKYWNAFFINEKAEKSMEGEITYEQAQAACEYIRQQMEKGETRIDLYAWDSFIIDEVGENWDFREMIYSTVNQFVASDGRTYELAYGYSLGSEGAATGVTLMRTSIILTQRVEYSKGIIYNRYNIDGSGEGILLKAYPIEGDRGTIPAIVNDEGVHAINLSVTNRQLIVPEGVKIIILSGDKLEQVVIPETVRDIYEIVGGENLKAVYIPESVKYIQERSCITRRVNNNDVPVEKIFGYAGTTAESYAREWNIDFCDLTGYELIPAIAMSNFEVPKAGENIQNILDTNKVSVADYSVSKIMCDTEDVKAVGGSTYTVKIYLEAKEGKAITPNTLMDINGTAITLEHTDVDSAIATYQFDVIDSSNNLNGLIPENDQYIYYVDGQKDTSMTGLVPFDGEWFFVDKGVLDTSKMGFVEYDSGIFYVAAGQVVSSANGLVEYDDKWYFVANGQVQKQHCGLAEYNGEWFYIDSGKLDTEMAGYVEYNGGLFYVAAGRILKDANGLAQDPDTKKWYFLAGGQVQKQHCGLAEYDNKWFYVINGELAETYIGEVEYDGSKFNVVNGMVIFE